MVASFGDFGKVIIFAVLVVFWTCFIFSQNNFNVILDLLLAYF